MQCIGCYVGRFRDKVWPWWQGAVKTCNHKTIYGLGFSIPLPPSRPQPNFFYLRPTIVFRFFYKLRTLNPQLRTSFYLCLTACALATFLVFPFYFFPSSFLVRNSLFDILSPSPSFVIPCSAFDIRYSSLSFLLSKPVLMHLFGEPNG